MSLLHAVDLSRHFSGLKALDGLTFHIDSGEILGLIGPNGAGKTTCFNVLTGFLKPTRGSFQYKGKNLLGLPPYEIARQGMVRTFQHTAIFRKLTVLEDVMIGTHLKTSHGLGAALLGRRIYRDEEREARKRALEILEFLGMANRATLAAENLPYGEQRNLEIAMALAAGPELLLLDEPAAGLNPEESVGLMRVIRSVRDTGITIMLVEHDMKVVMGICDRIVVLDHGVQIAEGGPQEIRENPEVIRVYLGRRKGSA